MDGIVALFIGLVSLLGFGSGSAANDATAQVKAAERQKEMVLDNAAGIGNTTAPRFDYETASRREGGFLVYKNQ